MQSKNQSFVPLALNVESKTYHHLQQGSSFQVKEKSVLAAPNMILKNEHERPSLFPLAWTRTEPATGVEH